MPIFIKTEIIKKEYLADRLFRNKIINAHKIWIESLIKTGVNIKSGFLVNELKKPGAGGLLLLEMNTYKEALEIVRDDPMIKNNIVDWELSEWIDIAQ